MNLISNLQGGRFASHSSTRKLDLQKLEFAYQLMKKQQIVNNNLNFLIKSFQMLIKLIFVHLEMSPDVTT